MNPIYKFTLSNGGESYECHPIYGEDLSKDFSIPNGEWFFRASLNGKLTFTKEDFTYIVNSPFDTEFLLEVLISYDRASWSPYWQGAFWKTDCEFDYDDGKVVVVPQSNDRYKSVLDGMEKEFDLIQLAPEIISVKADKRAMVQVYTPGDSSVGCFLSGMWWEQECSPEDNLTKLTNDFCFHLVKTIREVKVSETSDPSLPLDFASIAPTGTNYTISKGGYEFRYTQTYDTWSYTYTETFSIYQGATLKWQGVQYNSNPLPMPITVTLTPQGSATGEVVLDIRDIPVYERLVCDVATVRGQACSPIPSDDLVDNNRNYHYIIGYNFPDTIAYSDSLSSVPSQWGIYQPGQYYQPPTSMIGLQYFPVARSSWGVTSIWFAFSMIDDLIDESSRASFMLKDAMPLYSAISVLLGKIAPSITHRPTTEYSQFLYGINPITNIPQSLIISPKSNVIVAGYDQPAQKAPITLRNITDMLRDCFRCYWWIDEQNRFRIEHVEYFRRGGSYSSSQGEGLDLTTNYVPRNGKPWSYVENKYKYDKASTVARYQFGWMDDVTQLFEGYPIDIESKYVAQDNIERVDVSHFTSDIDYILLNPSSISQEGFVLMSAIRKNLITPDSSPVSVTPSSPRIIPLSLIVGEQIELNFSARAMTNGARMFAYFLDANNNLIASIGGGLVPTSTQTSYSINTVVPQGATQVEFVAVPPSSSLPASVELTLSSILGGYELPYLTFGNAGEQITLQNAYVAFVFLQQYYLYDLPARFYSINNERGRAYGVKKLMSQQVTFPAPQDINLYQLIKTGLGNGMIEKLSINLSSRKASATLKYDTE